MTDTRYPIGLFTFQGPNRSVWQAQIAALPREMRAAIANLDDSQLDTPYRDGGWTVRQVVHHVADSHINCYTRFKLALTENEPTVKTYEEQHWAELADGKSDPVEVSLALLEPLHYRWVKLLSSFREEDWQRAFIHPVNGRTTLDKALGMYAWHGRHHVAHITTLRERMGW